MNRLFLLTLLAFVLVACVQPSGTVPSATPTPAATSVPISTPSLQPSATATPSATLLPSATPVPSAAANASSVSTLRDAALRLEPVLNEVFNASRVEKRKDMAFIQIDQGVWSMGAVEAPYTFAVTLSNARTHWRPEELLEPAVNTSGTRNGFLSYSVGASDKANVMKCYGQRYELNLNLKSYSHTWFGLDYQPLMRVIMGRLVDACPP